VLGVWRWSRRCETSSSFCTKLELEKETQPQWLTSINISLQFTALKAIGTILHYSIICASLSAGIRKNTAVGKTQDSMGNSGLGVWLLLLELIDRNCPLLS